MTILGGKQRRARYNHRNGTLGWIIFLGRKRSPYNKGQNFCVLSVPRGWHISRISDRMVPLSVEQVKNKAEYVDRLSWLRASEIGSCGIDGNGRSRWKLTVDPLELFYRARKAKYVLLESKFHIVCTVNFYQRAEESIERQLILFRRDRPLREASGRKNIDAQDLLLHIIAYYKRVEGQTSYWSQV